MEPIDIAFDYGQTGIVLGLSVAGKGPKNDELIDAARKWRMTSLNGLFLDVAATSSINLTRCPTDRRYAAVSVRDGHFQPSAP